MNGDIGKERLLADVCEEGSDPGLRQVCFQQTLHWVRRRRKFRQAGTIAVSLAVLAGVYLLLSQTFGPQPGRTPPLTSFNSSIIGEQTGVTVVRTQPFPAANLVVTLPATTIIVTSVAHSSTIEIDDDALLNYAGAIPVALVRRDTDVADLVFVHSKDREALFGN